MADPSSFPPVYNDAFQQASENLRKTLPLVNKHKTPVNPVNYAVWYEYVSGHNQSLIDAIDTRLQKGETITAEITQYLYEKYVLMGMPDRINQTNSGLKLVVDNTIQRINKAEQTAGSCAEGLTSSQSLLEGCSDIEQIKSLLGDILNNTQKLTVTSQELRHELSESTREILKLRAELEAVKHSARTDSLTGLLNRGEFNKILKDLCLDNDQAVSLILFDIDHFKRVNDDFGHLLGDKVIQYFATVMKKHAEGVHPVARFGGEEMAMIILHSSTDEAFSLAESIRLTFANSRLKKRGSNETIGQVTVSGGMTMLMEGDSPQSLIQRADEALYLSKTAGRNQINFI